MKARVLALIPARSGSRGLQHKNIRPLAGIPLIAHTIRAAQESHLFDEIIVSTDSLKYKKIAQAYGASVPFLRTKKNASDTALTIDVVMEVVDHLRAGGYFFDVLVLLQATSPLRTAKHIKAAMKLFQTHKKSVCAVSPTKSLNLYRYFGTDGVTLQHILATQTHKQKKTTTDSPLRQQQQNLYVVNGAIYINHIADLRCDTNFNHNEIGFVMDGYAGLDIDNGSDFALAEALYKMEKDGE